MKEIQLLENNEIKEKNNLYLNNKKNNITYKFSKAGKYMI